MFKQHHANKLNNLDKMDVLLANYNLSKLALGETDNVINPTCGK